MPSAASTTYASNLYSTVLQRSGSASDVAAWATALDSASITPQQATAIFETSPEAADFVDPVIRLYQGFFDRAPDAAGLQGWVDALRTGALTLNQVAAGFAGSVEFQDLYGVTPSPTAFVTALYANVLGRAPDAPGLAAWVNALSTGSLSYAQVALGFTQSPEFIADSAPSVNNWLTVSDTRAEAGAVSTYPSGPILGATPIAGHNFTLSISPGAIAGSGLGGDTINAFVLDDSSTGPTLQVQTFSSALSITETGSNNVLNATIVNPGGYSPTITGVQTWNLTSAPTANLTGSIPSGGTATINAGANVSGVTTINDYYSSGNILVGTSAKPLQTALTTVGLDDDITASGTLLRLEIAAAALAGSSDTLAINLTGAPVNQAVGVELAVGPDSGTNGYETFAINAISGFTDLRLSQNATGTSNVATYSATTITVTGSGWVQLSTDASSNWNDLTTIDTTGATGNVTILGAASGANGILGTDAALTTFRGGPGNDRLDISDLTTTSAVNAITTLNGGGGINGLVLNSAVVEGTTPLASSVLNFQVIDDVDPGASGGVINWTNLGSAAAYLSFAGAAQAAPMTINNAPNGFSLAEAQYGNPSFGITINGPGGTADSLNLTVGSGVGPLGNGLPPFFGDNSGAITSNGFETITLTAQGGTDSILAMTATASPGAGETLIITGNQELDFNGAVALTGTSTTISIANTGIVVFNGTVSAQTIDASTSGGIEMNAPDLAVTGMTGDIITGATSFSNHIDGSVGNDTINGGAAGDNIVTDGGADVITLGPRGSPDVVGLEVVSASGVVTGSITAATSTDAAQPGFWGLAPGASPAPEGGLAANTGTSLDQSTVANFQAGLAATTDKILFVPAEWGSSGGNLGLVAADLATPVAGSAAGTDMVAAVVHIGGTVSANVNLIELTDATFANANALVSALHSGAYGISFAAPLAASGDFAHVLVAYNDASGNAHIADLDVTGAASASSTVLTERASDMVQLTGVSVASLQPGNVVFLG